MTRKFQTLLIAMALVLTSVGEASAKDHPSLVNPATAKCATCHEAVLAKAVKHPAALDGGCTSCHEFTKADGKTKVKLSADEPQLCLTCHDAMTKAAAGTLVAPHAPVTMACTSCHSPHSTEAPHLLTATPPALCLTCHDATEVNKTHKRSVSNSNCLLCHAPHGSENKKMLVAAKQHPPFAERSCEACHRQGRIARAQQKTNICFGCHDEKPFQAKFVHTAVRQGKCAGCHDPHMSPRDKFLRADGPALCTGCHPAIKARIDAAGAHPPAKDGCTTCHDPHKSPNARQLNDVVPGLCLTCHDADDKALAKKHLHADLKKTDCLACHDPHGSPKKPLLVTNSVHPPFAERACNSCHANDASNKFVASTKKEVCVACHSDIPDSAAKAKTQHPALEMVECTDCHTPHASKQARLVKLPSGGECTTCHDNKVAGPGEVSHGAISLVGCESCHEPHGGARKALLRAEPDDLCLGCHDKQAWKADQAAGTVTLLGRFIVEERLTQAIRTISLAGGIKNHPLVGHRALGKVSPNEAKNLERRNTTSFDGEFHCLTCHEPHKSVSGHLFRDGRKEICSKCHMK